MQLIFLFLLFVGSISSVLSSDDDGLLSLFAVFNTVFQINEPPSTELMKVDLSDLATVKTLGEGVNGQVKLLQHKTRADVSFAMKTIKLPPRLEKPDYFRRIYRRIEKEKQAMQRCNMPFIVKLKAVIEREDKVIFLTERASRHTMFRIRFSKGPFSDEDTRFYVATLMLTIEYMHRRGVIHRDLKFENLLLGSDGYLRLIDFGHAQIGLEETIEDNIGTESYMAPELLNKRPHGKGVDWWSLGIIMLEMLSRAPVFSNPSKLANSDIIYPDYLNKDAVDLLKRLLQRDPSKRLGVVKDSWKIIFEHPWMKGFDWKSLMQRNMKPPHRIWAV